MSISMLVVRRAEPGTRTGVETLGPAVAPGSCFTGGAPRQERPRRRASASLRWVQVLVPRNSARTLARNPSSGRPTSRSALPAASGHSNHGSTRGVAIESTTRRSRPSRTRPMTYSWTTVSVPSSSMWLSRKWRVDEHPGVVGRGHDVDASSPSHAERRQRAGHLVPRPRIVGSVERRARRAPSPPAVRLPSCPSMIVPPAFHPAHRSACWMSSSPSGVRRCIVRAALVAPRTPRRHRLLGRVARDEGGHGEVVEQLVDRPARPCPGRRRPR